MKNIYVLKLFICLTFLVTTEIVLPFNNLKLISELSIFENDTTFRISYLYENQKNIVLETRACLKNSAWSNLSQVERVFIDNSCTNQVERTWKTDRWKDSHSIEYIQSEGQNVELSSYIDNNIKVNYKKVVSDFKNSLIEKKTEYYLVNNSWKVSSIFDYVFENSILKEIDFSLYSNGFVSSHIKNTYTYNPDSTVFSILEQDRIAENTYQNVRLNKWYYYPGTKLISSQRSSKWNPNLMNWENDTKLEYVYDSNGQLISELYYYWKSMFWEKSASYIYGYDTERNLLRKQLLLPIYKQWRNTISLDYSELNQNNIQTIESTNEFWGGRSGELVSSYIPFLFNNEMKIQKAKQIKITYSVVDNIIDPQGNLFDQKFAIPIYPNPSDGIFYFNNAEIFVNSWSVYNLEGSLIKKNDISSKSGVIDITGAPKGVYLLKIISSDKTFNQKLTIK